MSTAPVRLPSVIGEFLRRYGRRPEFTAGQDWVLGPHQLHYDGDVLIIRDENQYTAEWGATDLDHPDPPVLYRRGDDDWIPYLPRYSLAVADFALCETVFADQDLHNAAEVAPALVAELRRTYRTVTFPEYWTYPTEGAGPTLWLSAPGKLLRVDQFDGPWINVRGQTAGDLAELLADIPARWALGTGFD